MPSASIILQLAPADGPQGPRGDSYSANLMLNTLAAFEKSYSSQGDWYNLRQACTVHLENGKTYTISGKTNGVFSSTHNVSVNTNGEVVLWICSASSSPQGTVNQIVSHSSMSADGTSGRSFVWSRPTGDYYLRINYYTPGTWWVKEVKVEEGSVINTQWTPAASEMVGKDGPPGENGYAQLIDSNGNVSYKRDPSTAELNTTKAYLANIKSAKADAAEALAKTAAIPKKVSDLPGGFSVSNKTGNADLDELQLVGFNDHYSLSLCNEASQMCIPLDYASKTHTHDNVEADTLDGLHASSFARGGYATYVAKGTEAPRWVRIAQASTYSDSCIISITNSYANNPPYAVCFALSLSYRDGNKMSVTQVGRGSLNFTKVRVVYPTASNDPYYIEVWYNSSSIRNTLYVHIANTRQIQLLSSYTEGSVPESGYATKEWAFADGLATANITASGSISAAGAIKQAGVQVSLDGHDHPQYALASHTHDPRHFITLGDELVTTNVTVQTMSPEITDGEVVYQRYPALTALTHNRLLLHQDGKYYISWKGMERYGVMVGTRLEPFPDAIYASLGGISRWNGENFEPLAASTSHSHSDHLPAIAYDFTAGFLVKTDISESVASAVLAKISGNPYSASLLPIDTTIQFTHLSILSSISYATGFNAGSPLGDVHAFILDGVICLWFKQPKRYVGFSVFVSDLRSSVRRNRVAAILDAALPPDGVTKQITITPLDRT